MTVRHLVRAWVPAVAGVVLVVAPTPAPARPGPTTADVGPVWAEPDPAAVIGRWRGPATWKACPAGAAKVVLDVARDGSGYQVDLAPVLDGLGPMVLVPAAARRLDAGRDDLTVVWLTGKPNRATLEVRFASGCTGTLRLSRDTSGAPACDELAALEVIGGSCPAASVAPVPPADRAVIAAIGKSAAARGKAARTCARHLTPLRAALLDAGCVPAPVDLGAPGVRVPECEALLVTVSKLMRCEKVPADVKQRLYTSMQKVARWSALGQDEGADQEELRRRAADTCAEARSELAETMSLVGCVP